MSWQGRSVLVTGGAGFIGSHLVRRLVALGAKVRVVDNLSRGRIDNLGSVFDKIHFVNADLTSAEACLHSCSDIEVVFHLASKVGGIGYYMTKPAEVYTNNVLMDTLMFGAARSASVQRFLFSSSAHVYPGHLQMSYDSAPLREQDAYPANPAISYGWGKLFTEKLIEYQGHEGSAMRTAVVRIVGAFGEGQDIVLDMASAIPAFCRRAIEFPKRSPFTIYGLGKETRSYCYVGDVVEGMVHAVSQLETQAEIGPLNLGREGRTTILELVRMVIEISGKDIEVQNLPAQESGIRGQAVDCQLASKVLARWSPQVSLREGIERTYRDIEMRLKGEKNLW